MSWSTSATGKPAAVAARIALSLSSVKCSEPEESIKNTVGTAIATALAAFPEGQAVKVEASGSQSTSGDGSKAVNQLSVKIEPLWGFVE